ncbi:MAG: glycosyltransferase family 2 protein [Alphaproteobacteria bacterium]
MQKKLISFVIPAYNEEGNVERLHQALAALFARQPKYDWEAIIVENGSQDATYQKLLTVHNVDQRFKILKLSRNFTAEGGISAGLHYAKGDAIIIMYADLEDPPEVTTQFVEKWELGYENVYGVVRKRHGTWLRRQNSKMFYWVLDKLTGGIIPRYVADFRLIDRKVCDVINTMPERTRFLRGLFAWAGFKSVGIPYDRTTRIAGESKASTVVVLRLALRGILAFSHVPLHLAGILGLMLCGISFLGIIYFVIRILIFGLLPFDGYGTLVCLILFLFGFLFVLLGILSEYIAMMFEEVKQRPVFIVSEEIGF